MGKVRCEGKGSKEREMILKRNNWSREVNWEFGSALSNFGIFFVWGRGCLNPQTPSVRHCTQVWWVGIVQSVQRLATGWRVRGSNPIGGRDFPHPTGPSLGPTQTPHNAYRVSFPGIKRTFRTWRKLEINIDMCHSCPQWYPSRSACVWLRNNTTLTHYLVSYT
jgi:hypothetical protein